MADKAETITYENVAAILRFLTIFEDDTFQAGNLVARQGNLPFWDYNNRVIQFIKELYANGWVVDFNWTAWQQEAKQYWNNPVLIEQADVDTIRKLLTTHVRKDRFCDGHMAEAIKNGHIVVILRRLEQLSSTIL